MLLRLPRDKDARLAITLIAIAAGMLGLSYLAVPLYRLFCQVTGIEGTVSRADAAPGQILARKMTVRFDANIDPKLPWLFKPAQIAQEPHIGEVIVARYRAKNLSDRPITASAVFNVTPEEAGVYFRKIQCFCFELQTLEPGQEVEMPVTYFVDPKIAKDRRLDGLGTMTLSYTFYPRTDAKVDN